MDCFKRLPRYPSKKEVNLWHELGYYIKLHEQRELTDTEWNKWQRAQRRLIVQKDKGWQSRGCCSRHSHWCKGPAVWELNYA